MIPIKKIINNKFSANTCKIFNFFIRNKEKFDNKSNDIYFNYIKSTNYSGFIIISI